MRVVRRLGGLLSGVTAAATVACGTAVFRHRIEVRVNDPAGRLGPPPIEVSLFDRQMGYSQGWSDQFKGTTSAAAPFVEFDSYSPAIEAWSLTGRYRADATPDGWRIELEVDIPAPRRRAT